MNGEINRNESELNEQALDQVSGGYTLPDRPKARAYYICVECRTLGLGMVKCLGSREQLAEYIEEHNINTCFECPFRGRKDPKA